MAPTAPPAPSAPLSLGRYVLHRELASGGMASVYFGRLLGPSGFARTVAIKRPHKHLMNDRDFAMMLIDEARLAARIRHPNVVSTLDIIETPSELALVMDYVHGESLSKLWAAARSRGERVPLPIAAAILIDALHGLHAAHEASDEGGRPLGIVHRDVSPQNLIVGADGITRIVDFGIAKAAGRLMTTRDGSIKGKYAYMAPEQIRGQAVTRQTDIFAASIVLWELLTGEGLFRGGSEGEEIYKCLEGVVDPPSKRDPKLPHAFDAIVLRGLMRDPAERYASAREMAADIERATPAVRPSEIAAWVEWLAGGVLATRAEIISEMERSTLDQASSGVGLSASIERPVSDPVASIALSDRERSPISQVSHAGVVAERMQTPAVTASRSTNRLMLGAVVATLLAALFAVSRINRQSAAHGAADAASVPVVETEPSAASTIDTEGESAGVLRGRRPIVPAPAVSTLVPSPVASSIASAPSVAPAPPSPPAAKAAVPAATASAKPAHSAPKQTKSGGSCDPPYTIDAQGREIFKPSCL